MTAKRYRWVCPSCKRGALGPKAPRLDATVRFCLPCSAKKTTLVARICPAVERERAEAENRRRSKATRQRAKATRRREVQKLREALNRAECRLATMDRRWPNDLCLEEEQGLLEEHNPAMIMLRPDGALYLVITGPHGTALRTNPHSRATMAVLVDYASEVGHPDAEKMQADLLSAVEAAMGEVKAASDALI